MNKNIAAALAGALSLSLLPTPLPPTNRQATQQAFKNPPKALAAHPNLPKVRAARLLLKQAKANAARANAVQL